jgi:hypothetical protein
MTEVLYARFKSPFNTVHLYMRLQCPLYHLSYLRGQAREEI